jgi:hypothetical protein
MKVPFGQERARGTTRAVDTKGTAELRSELGNPVQFHHVSHGQCRTRCRLHALALAHARSTPRVAHASMSYVFAEVP